MEPATVLRRAAFNNRRQLFNKKKTAERGYEKENFTFVHFISPKMISK